MVNDEPEIPELTQEAIVLLGYLGYEIVGELPVFTQRSRTSPRAKDDANSSLIREMLTSSRLVASRWKISPGLDRVDWSATMALPALINWEKVCLPSVRRVMARVTGSRR
ncbi:hypothetical protein [Desulfonatronum lacustre]|uniref:hypothetical protein n=1 Tax=Desulfonatronum lacustre TaxID=66849 RepID=UPI00048EC803|nr:hypothetical protein [Desulfonatronum lacustre]